MHHANWWSVGVKCLKTHRAFYMAFIEIYHQAYILYRAWWYSLHSSQVSHCFFVFFVIMIEDASRPTQPAVHHSSFHHPLKDGWGCNQTQHLRMAHPSVELHASMIECLRCWGVSCQLQLPFSLHPPCQAWLKLNKHLLLWRRVNLRTLTFHCCTRARC